ncbi:MAG TPA: HypC/HybG/HupF family hydrogenase formation chaperone [Acidimicrobiales bacterium]|nr:HypC/HybG/HupF family hydrogenase formation chaperone [Acidimicrobiales bacterium]
MHPVIVGTRALPAEAVEGADVTAALRTLVSPGDVIAAVAPADQPAVAPLLRRAAAWGATTVWMGAGDRPPSGAADHVLWVAAADGAWSGDLVLLYHLLWELTHVCFEHPGLLSEEACTEDVCITCSDQARLGEVVAPGAEGWATVRTAAGAEAVETTLVGPVEPGDLVLVHAGTAIDRVDE